MAKDFTKKEIKAYLANTSRCPRCGEHTIKIEEPFTEESMSAEVYCDNDECDIKFHEVYELVTIEIIK